MGVKKRSDYLALTSSELAVLSQGGDKAAFEALASRFINTRYSNFNSTFLDNDDFVQEGMVGFLNAVRTFNESKGVPFEAYASVCMRNSIKTAATNVPKDVPVDNDSDEVQNLEASDDPLAQVITSERFSEVLDLCETVLSKVEKAVIFLVAGGMNYEEIGKKLGMSSKSVDNAVQRARRKLKQV